MVFPFQVTFNTKACGSIMGVWCIGATKVAFGKAEIIDRIEKIRLANTICPADTYDPRVEAESAVKVIFELNQRYGPELKQLIKNVCKIQVAVYKIYSRLTLSLRLKFSKSGD